MAVQHYALQIQTLLHISSEWPSQEEPGSGSTAFASVSDISAPACRNGICPPLRPVSLVHKNNRGPCCPPMSNSSTFPWNARPDRSGRFEIIEWLLNICPMIWCGQAVVRTTDSKEEDECFIKTYNLQNVYAYFDDITVTGVTVVDDKKLNCLLAATADCRLMLNEEKSQIRVATLVMLGHKISFNKVEPDPDRLQPLLDLLPLTSLKGLKRASSLFSYCSKWNA